MASNKITQEFTYHHPLTHKVVRDMKIVTEHVGDLIIEGLGYFDPSASRIDVFERYAVDIDFIKWKGTDIKPMLVALGSLEEFEEATIKYFANLIEGQEKKSRDAKFKKLPSIGSMADFANNMFPHIQRKGA
jgi:hypothetical protein